MTGSKHMSIKVPPCNLRFIDSLNFISMALADMHEAFGEKELAKGFSACFQSQKISVMNHSPDISFYNPNDMKPENKDYVFAVVFGT